MAPITKENEVPASPPKAPAASATSAGFRPDETASRPQPVALELPVTVNGARTVEGSDKREPFSETTKTVLVFGNGAVLRLSSPVAPGQLLFLTNEKTKKEVVCQVVKSKNYRNVSGYVELEFTESVVGFWGMRFPTDRIATPPSAPATVVPPAAKVPQVAPPAPAIPRPAPAPAVPPPVAVAPITSTPAPSALAAPAPTSKSPEPIPPQAKSPMVQTQPPVMAAALPVVEATPVAPAIPQVPAPPVLSAPVSEPSIPKQPATPAAPQPTIAGSLASSVMSLLSSPEVPPAVAPSKPAPAAPAQVIPFPASNSGETSSEELRLKAARLQEQLSSMLFSPSPETKPPSPSHDSKPTSDLAAKIMDLASAETPVVKVAAPPKAVLPPVKSAFETEEVKIPSWLEPLARNAAAPTSTQDLVEQEKTKQTAQLASRVDVPAEPLTLSAPDAVPQIEAPAIGIGSLFPPEEEAPKRQRSSGSSKRGLWIGVAAAVVGAAAAGGWYLTHSSSGAQGTAATATSPASTGKNSVAPSSTSAPSQPAQQNSVLAVPQPVSKPISSELPSNYSASRPVELPQPAPTTRDNTRGAATTIPAAATERVPKPVPATDSAAAAVPEPKKQSIGEVHLASPMVSRSANSQQDGDEAAPTIGSGEADGDPGNLASGIALDSSKQPSAPEAPLPVGGDVKPAKLLRSVPPIYPAMAKSQHVSGDVQVDASIDANGKVTTVKVVSGPALLRQSALDAVRQWKYEAATLDGKPVAMHLTVTLQFRPQ